MDYTYWRTQKATKPLFPDAEWSKPERRDQAGRLGIIGGNKLGFAGVAASYSTALDTGAGQTRILLPDALKKTIPKAITDTLFTASTQSGGLAKDALTDMKALGDWANGILLVGDAGRNSETSVVYEQFIESYAGPLTITRDAVDLVRNNTHSLVGRPDTMIVGSFAQTQKIFQAVYYPKILTFSMQLMQAVEALHKFTTTYPIAIVTLHQDHLIIAHSGDVITQEWGSPLQIWRGETAARMATYWLWSTQNILQSAVASIVISDR